MIEYVLSYCELNRLIVIIQKKRPEWQAGTITLPGGHVEPGENWAQAAVREVKEETNLNTYKIKLAGVIYKQDKYKVFVTRNNVAGRLVSLTDEEASFATYDEIMESTRILPNLSVMLPLLRAKRDGWLISMLHDSHQVFEINTCHTLKGFTLIEEYEYEF